MSEEDKKRLIELIESDLKKLTEVIEKHESLTLKKIIKYIPIGIPLFSINLEDFIQLITKYCFNITMENPLTIESKASKLLNERLELISNIFFKDIRLRPVETFNYPFHLGGTQMPSAISILFLLYLAIFKKFISSSEMISNIFQDLYEEWIYSFSNNKMPLTFITYSPVSTEVGDYKISEKFTIRAQRPHLKLEDSPMSKGSYFEYISSYFVPGAPKALISPVPCYLVYQEEVDFEFKSPFKDGKPVSLYELDNTKLIAQEKHILGKFHEMINSLCLFGKDFKFDDFIIELPWWFYSEANKYDKFKKPIKAHELRVLYKDEIKDFINFYSDIEQSRIFLDKEQGIIARRYFQIHNREDLPDIILDACIILEMLFTRSIKQELKYRLCLNGGLFLASNWEEFNEYNKIFSDIYDLRSTIVHGGNWKKKINELMRDEKFQDEYHFIFEVRQLINKILRKVVSLLVKDPGILKKFSEKNYFLENSDIIKK